MASKDQVEHYLRDFFIKYRTFDIVFRDERGKNRATLLELEISPLQRRKVIEAITYLDYCEGPLEDTLYHAADMWVFGKMLQKKEIYIKISMGLPGSRVLCISFHLAEYPLKYPLRESAL